MFTNKFSSSMTCVSLVATIIVAGCGSEIPSETNSFAGFSASKAIVVSETAVFAERFLGKSCGTVAANTQVILGVTEEGRGAREEVIFSSPVCNGTLTKGYVSRSSLKYPSISIPNSNSLHDEDSQSGQKLVSFYIDSYKTVRSWVNQPWFIPRWSPSPTKNSCAAHSTVALYQAGFKSPFAPKFDASGEIVENIGDIYASINVYSLTKWLSDNGWQGWQDRHALREGDYVFSASNGEHIDHVYVFVSYGDSQHTFAKVLDNQGWGVHDRSLVGTESVGRYMYHFRNP